MNVDTNELGGKKMECRTELEGIAILREETPIGRGNTKHTLIFTLPCTQ